MTSELRAVAEECCRGRIAAVVEGGYDLHALAGSLDAVIETLHGPPSAPAAWPASGIASEPRPGVGCRRPPRAGAVLDDRRLASTMQ